MADFDRNRNYSRERSGGGRSDRNRSRFDRRDRGRERSGGRRREGSRDIRSERPQMHEAICDKCGEDCEVPFRPTQGKPIYCDDCFKDKSRDAGSRSGFEKPINNENFDHINKKLDKILNILETKKSVEMKEKKKEEKQPDFEELESVEKEQPKLKKSKKKKTKKKK